MLWIFLFILVISDGFKMERKSSLQTTSDFCNSKITEAILEEITVHGIFRTQLHMKIHNLYWSMKHQIRKWLYLDRTPHSKLKKVCTCTVTRDGSEHMLAQCLLGARSFWWCLCSGFEVWAHARTRSCSGLMLEEYSASIKGSLNGI